MKRRKAKAAKVIANGHLWTSYGEGRCRLCYLLCTYENRERKCTGVPEPIVLAAPEAAALGLDLSV
jgi:hypothetical protein